MYSWLFLVPLLLILGWYIHFRWSHRRILAAASLLPCPPTYPVFGNVLMFTGGLSRITQNLIRMSIQFPGICCIWLGPVPLFIVTDANDARIVLNSSNTLEKDYIYRNLTPFLGNGLLTGPVTIWKKYRRLISPVFHPTNIKLFQTDFNDVSRNLCKELLCGKPVDPKDGLFIASIDVIQRTVISKMSISSSTKQKIKLIEDGIGRLFMYRVFKVWLYSDWIYKAIYGKDLKLLYKYMDDLSEEILEGKQLGEKISRNESSLDHPEGTFRKNIFDVILANPEKNNEDHKWSDEIHTMTFAGNDTVMSTMSFFLVTLANHQEVQAKIRSEIREVMGDSRGDVSTTDLEAMTYLECALLESMRLHSTVPGILRRVTKDTTVCSSSTTYTLPAGSRVIIALCSMNWRADRFPEPDRFLPERFLDSKKELSRYTLPFSAGPRNCIGKAFAMSLMKTMAVHLLRNHQVTSSVKMENIEYEMKFVMTSKAPLPISLKPIMSS